MARTLTTFRLYEREVFKVRNGKKRSSFVWYLEYQEEDSLGEPVRRNGKPVKRNVSTGMIDKPKAEEWAASYLAEVKGKQKQILPTAEPSILHAELVRLAKEKEALEAELNATRRELATATGQVRILTKADKNKLCLKDLKGFADFYTVLYPTEIDSKGGTNIEDIRREYLRSGKTAKSIKRVIIPFYSINEETQINGRALILCPYLAYRLKKAVPQDHIGNYSIDRLRTLFESYFLSAKEGREDITAYPIEEIETRTLTYWINNHGKSSADKGMLSQMLRTIFKFYYESNAINLNPAKDIQVEVSNVHKKKYLFKREEIAQMLVGLDSPETMRPFPFRTIRAKLFFATMFYTGMRANEVKVLRWKNIHADRIEVVEALKTQSKVIGLPKNQTKRITFSFPTLYNALQWYRTKVGEENINYCEEWIDNKLHYGTMPELGGGFIFGGLSFHTLKKNGWNTTLGEDLIDRKLSNVHLVNRFKYQPPSGHWVSENFDLAMDAIGLKEKGVAKFDKEYKETNSTISPHALRLTLHTYLTTMKLTDFQIRNAFGWSDIDMQQNYFQQSAESVAEMQGIIGGLLEDFSKA